MSDASRPKQRIKTLYFPGGDSGGSRSRGIVAVSFNPADPVQMRLWERVGPMKAADVRAALGIRTLPELESAILAEQQLDASISRAEVLRNLLVRKMKGAAPDSAYAEPGGARGITGTPARTEDSPDLARRYLDELANGHVSGKLRILDPFAGTAAFPIEAGLRGHESYYCERSPVAAAWARLKIDLLSRSNDGRGFLKAQLEELREKTAELIEEQEGSDASASDHDFRQDSHAAVFRTIFRSEESAAGILPHKPQLRAAVAARRVADDLLVADPILGRAFELAAASATGRWARAIKRRGAAKGGNPGFELAGFIGESLEGLGELCDETRAFRAPRFLCEDARGLDQFPSLGVNAIVASLPSFSAVDVVSDAERVEAWMLRLPPDVGSGLRRGLRARKSLPSLGRRSDRSGDGRESGGARWELSSPEVGALMDAMTKKTRTVVGSDLSYFAARLVEVPEARELVRMLSRSKNRRAAMALVRYLGMIATVLDAIFGWHGRDATRLAALKGAAILEISDTVVGDATIDLEPVFTAWFRAGLAKAVAWDAPQLGTTMVRGRGASEERQIAARALLFTWDI